MSTRGELEYTAWVHGCFGGQVALVWPLPLAVYGALVLLSDITNLANVTLGAPLLGLCLYQYFVTKKGWTLQVRLLGRPVTCGQNACCAQCLGWETRKAERAMAIGLAMSMSGRNVSALE